MAVPGRAPVSWIDRPCVVSCVASSAGLMMAHEDTSTPTTSAHVRMRTHAKPTHPPPSRSEESAAAGSARFPWYASASRYCWQQRGWCSTGPAARRRRLAIPTRTHGSLRNCVPPRPCRWNRWRGKPRLQSQSRSASVLWGPRHRQPRRSTSGPCFSRKADPPRPRPRPSLLSRGLRQPTPSIIIPMVVQQPRATTSTSAS